MFVHGFCDNVTNNFFDNITKCFIANTPVLDSIELHFDDIIMTDLMENKLEIIISTIEIRHKNR